MNPYIMTAPGRKFYLLDMSENVFDIEEIADALSKLCRFTGHTDRFYSVAEHSVRVAAFLPVEYQLEGLLHDAPEAYLGDVASPLRAVLPGYNAIYSRVETWMASCVEGLRADRRIAADFGRPIIKAADRALLEREAHGLFISRHWADIGVKPPKHPLPASASCWTPTQARRRFLRAYRLALAGEPLV